MGAVGKTSDSLGANQSKPVEATEMDDLTGDVAAFFDQHEVVYPLYGLFCEKLLVEFPDTRGKVQKSQISYYNRHLYACVSFLKVRKKAELSEDYFVLMLGLPAPLESGRVAAKTEPYPGRWTTHFVISDPPTWTRRRSAGSRKRTGSRRGSRAWACLPPHAPGVEPLLVRAAGAGIARVSWGASGVRGGVRYPLAPPYFPARYLRRRNAVKYGSVSTEPSRPTLPPHSLIPQSMSG